MIFVIAESVGRARSWCRGNGVSPGARDTGIATPRGPHLGRGRRLTATDRVVVIDHPDWEQIRLSLIPAGLYTVVQPEFVT